MTATEKLGYVEMEEGQGQKHLLYNEGNRQTEAFLCGVVTRAASPPGSPTAGQTYIIATGGNTGVWAGFAIHDIAHYYNGTWVNYTPVEGVVIWVNDEDVPYRFDGTTWAQETSGVDPTQDATFTGSFLEVKNTLTASSTLRAEGGGGGTNTGTGVVEAVGDNNAAVGIIRTRDTGGNDIWEWRMFGAAAAGRPQYAVFRYSPNDANYHEVFELIPNNATNSDPTDMRIKGNLLHDHDRRQVREAHFSTVGDAQVTETAYRGQTTDATQTEIFIDGSSERFDIQDDSTVQVVLFVVARRTDANDESAGYRVEGVIDRNAGTVALVGTVTTTVIAEDQAAWDVTITADDTAKAFAVQVTGEASKTIKWVAFARVTEVVG